MTTIDTLVDLLDAVPPAKLELLRLVDSVTKPDGTVDTDQVIALEEKFTEATPEALNYSYATHRLIRALRCKLDLPYFT